MQALPPKAASRLIAIVALLALVGAWVTSAVAGAHDPSSMLPPQCFHGDIDFCIP